ncbi:MAG: BirA family biotin operon repressor/biotin-[acetyl-CoA-carboxylase] ligase, partial [Parvicellaceae bacterium]
MSTLFIGQKKIVLPSVDSTNNFAANLIKETNVVDGTVILSEKQTNGRGQSGNSWQSAYGDNITCSYILRPKFLDIEEQFYISIITSLAIISTLKSYGIEPKIKWPNDILVGSRKIAGILIENSISGKTLNHSIIGVGLNVNQTSFDLGISATSIANVTGQIQIKETVLDGLSGNLEK